MGDDVKHRSAQDGDGSAVFFSQFQDHIDAVNRRRKGRDQQSTLCLHINFFQVWENRTLRGREARKLGVGGVADQTLHAFFTILSQALNIKGFAIHGGMVKFEITCVNHDANRGVNRYGEAIRHGVRVADEFN